MSEIQEKIGTLDLNNAAKGALPELFQKALRAVMENLCDTDTPWEEKRSITIKFTFATVEARDEAIILTEVTSKLAGSKPEVSSVLIDHDRSGGELVAVPKDLLQRQMFPKAESPENVTQMPEAKQQKQK